MDAGRNSFAGSGEEQAMTRIGWMLLGMIIGLAAPAKAEDEPAYINTVGKWEVAGFIKQNGSMAVCRMLTKAEEGLSFAYMTAIAATAEGVAVKTMFMYPAAAEEMLSIAAAVTFDGKGRTHLKAGITSGYVHAELPSELGTMQRMVDLLQRSRVMAIVTGTGPNAAILHVKLDDSAAAFDANGVCMKEVMQKAVDQMKAAAQ